MVQLKDFDCQPIPPMKATREVPLPPWRRCTTAADLVAAQECRRKEEEKIRRSMLAQLFRIPTGPLLAGVHRVKGMVIIPLQTIQQLLPGDDWTLEFYTDGKDWTRKREYMILRRVSYANACYLPIPLRRIPSNEPMVVVRFHMVYFPPVWDGEHLYRDASWSARNASACSPEYKAGITSYKSQCLVKGCDCGNMIFENEYERNRHMDSCFDGRYLCTGCNTPFHYHDEVLSHVETGCPMSKYAEVFTIDPIPYWRQKGSKHSKLLLVPHSEDHLYEELGYTSNT